MNALLKFSLILLLLHALTAQAALTATNVAQGCEAEHSLFIKSDGSLWAMGDNQYGELGDGTTNNINFPEQIVASNVTAVAAGGHYSLFTKTDGSLWAVGWKNVGELGDGNDSFYIYTTQPEEIVTNNVKAIAVGLDFSFFIKTDGSLWAMGDDYNGQLGDGTQAHTDAIRPEQIVSSNVVAVAGGGNHALFLKSDGSLWGMGDNSYGELGSITSTYYTSTPQVAASNVVAIAAGRHHSLFIKTDGSLWGMGENNLGQLGQGTTGVSNQQVEIVASNVVAVAAGYQESLFIKSDGSLWQMGDGNAEQTNGVYLDPSVPQQLVATNVTAVAAGLSHSLYLKSDGSLWGFGADEYGSLGDGFTGIVAFPLQEGPPEVQIFPPPQPILDTPLTSQQTNLQINATCGFGTNYCLLGATNLTLPFSQWTPLATNSVVLQGIGNFSVTLTNVVNLYGQQFYLLRSQ